MEGNLEVYMNKTFNDNFLNDCNLNKNWIIIELHKFLNIIDRIFWEFPVRIEQYLLSDIYMYVHYFVINKNFLILLMSSIN